jgi:hypothetical protein
MDRIRKYHAGNFRLFGHFFGHSNLASIPLNEVLKIKKSLPPLLKI